MKEMTLIKGNEAIAEAALQAGCRYYFGYPITPQTELTEYMAKMMPKAGGVFLQAESEIAAINMVYGAAAAGARTMTSSSSPGFSLKQEGISYLAAAELPCVLINVQRGGPGLGGIQPAQGDYFQATKGGGHGDYRNIVLAPNSVQELFDLSAEAFDLADKYRNPVVVLADGALGQMMEPVLMEVKAAGNYEKPWAITGKKGRKEANVVYTLFLEPEDLENVNRRLQAKYKLIRNAEMRWEEINTADADIILVAYGITARIALSALEMARAEGLKVGMVRPMTLWPFPAPALAKVAEKAKAFVVVELSAGQMVEDVELAIRCSKPVHFYGRTGGMLPDPNEIYAEILKAAGAKE